MSLLEIRDLTVIFSGSRGRLPWRKVRNVRAVQGASLSIDRGEAVGLVGESGSGKTTIGRAILRFVRPSAGSIRLGEFEVTQFGKRTPQAYRRAVQVVFQDPVGSLNPAMTVRDIISEPLRINRGLKGSALDDRCSELMGLVGLEVNSLDRFPHEFSGGQRQRIAIARALATDPDLLVLDEPVSALDVSTQSQIINLLEELQRESGVAFLFIAHDLAVVRHLCQRVVVMYHSRIVEVGSVDEICERPTHPYTALLIASIPDPDPVVQREKSQLRRVLGRGLAGATGVAPVDACPFVERCPYVMAICHSAFPELVATSSGGEVACHLHTDGPGLAGRPLTELWSESDTRKDSHL